MHSDFSEWFRAAGIELPDDALKKRWPVVDEFQVNRDDVISLADVFFGFFEGKDSFLSSFRKAFQDADSNFRMKDNNRELSVLAGAILVTVIESDSVEVGDLAALALVSGAAQNLRATPCCPDIPESAAKHLSRRSVNRGELNPDDAEDEKQHEIAKLRRDLDLVSEETNVLWWVFGESSRDTEKRWSEYNSLQTAIMVGKELADLTRIAPGPPAAAALLRRVMDHAKGKAPDQVSVKDAISAVPLEWRQNFAKNYCPTSLANLRPVSQGIKLSVDLTNSTALGPALASSTKIQRNGKIAPQLLAYQVLIECLLAGLWLRVK
jgi:hypothetical protein